MTNFDLERLTRLLLFSFEFCVRLLSGFSFIVFNGEMLKETNENHCQFSDTLKFARRLQNSFNYL